eukprot:m.86177 g.86177  ORF g.86177 m.86177 type:complete len:643 (+) comp14455_c0_seq3:239-2167(+)
MGCCYCSHEDSDPEVQEVHDTIKRSGNEFKGPLKEGRRIRDVFFLLLFIVFLIGMGVVAWRSFSSGDPLRIVNGYDSFGNICGVDNRGITVQGAEGHPNVGLDMRDYRYLYYVDPTAASGPYTTVCVSSCPSISTVCSTGNDCENAGVCFNSGPYTYINSSSIPDGESVCPDYVYESSTLLGLRRCVPSANSTLAADFFTIINSYALVEQVFSDLIAGYEIFGYAAAVAVVVCFIVIILMRCFVKVLVYSLVVLGLVGTLALSVVTYMDWKDLSDKLNATPADMRLDTDVRNERLLYGFMIFLFIFTALVWIITLAVRNRIRLSVVILQQASKALVRMPWVYLSPLMTNIIMLGFIAYWLAVYAYMATSGDGRLVQGRIQYDAATDYRSMWWYHLFGLFWVSQFILACEELVVAGAVSTWFFTRKDEVLVSPFWGSVGRLIRYHLGSAAFGSLIIAFVKMIRFVFEYVNHKLEANKGPIVDFLVKCFRCCLWCLEKFLRFINKNAYIEIAIYGYSFCTAARQAFKTLLNNAIRVAVLNLVSSFVLFVCKLFVVAGVGIICYYWITQFNTSLSNDLNYYGAVVLVCCMIAYIIADQFLSVYDMAVDTIFLCFAEDEKRNNGKDRPYYMDASLRQFLKDNSDDA